MTDHTLDLNITKSHGGFTLSCEATFDRGITAVFGPSGSGKSTLLDSIAGLTTPDSGHIVAFGETLYSSSPHKNVSPEKRRFGYVFQDSALFPHMSVEENVNYGYRLTPTERRTVELDQLISLFQLSALLGRNVESLSGGETQRVALARALATSPRLLLLDEPLASLDAAFKGPIIRYLARIWKDLQIPMVYVSHSMSEVMALAHNVLVLNDGAVVALGRPSHVLTHPNVKVLADYATIENMIEAEIATPDSDDTATTLQRPHEAHSPRIRPSSGHNGDLLAPGQRHPACTRTTFQYQRPEHSPSDRARHPNLRLSRLHIGRHRRYADRGNHPKRTAKAPYRVWPATPRNHQKHQHHPTRHPNLVFVPPLPGGIGLR
jgi:molybdate transport system ATP-binding protein